MLGYAFFRLHDGKFYRAGGNLAFRPLLERKSHPCHAAASFIRNPHGAMKQTPSAKLGERITTFDGRGRLVLGREFDIDERMNALREGGVVLTVMRHDHHPATLLGVHRPDVRPEVGGLIPTLEREVWRNLPVDR